MPDKMIRVPVSNLETKETVEEELDANEMLQALLDAVNEKRDSDELADPSSIEAYGSMKEIDVAEKDGVITPAKAERLRIKGRRQGLPR
jgi:hypothetical protein